MSIQRCDAILHSLASVLIRNKIYRSRPEVNDALYQYVATAVSRGRVSYQQSLPSGKLPRGLHEFAVFIDSSDALSGGDLSDGIYTKNEDSLRESISVFLEWIFLFLRAVAKNFVLFFKCKFLFALGYKTIVHDPWFDFGIYREYLGHKNFFSLREYDPFDAVRPSVKMRNELVLDLSELAGDDALIRSEQEIAAFILMCLPSHLLELKRFNDILSSVFYYGASKIICVSSSSLMTRLAWSNKKLTALVVQHGAGYGAIKGHIWEYYESLVPGRFIAWGWGLNNIKSTRINAFIAEVKNFAWREEYILFVESGYSGVELSDFDVDSDLYISDTCKEISLSLTCSVKVKAKHKRHGFDFSRQLLFDYKVPENWSFAESMSGASLVIIDSFFSTSFLELLGCGKKPFVIYMSVQDDMCASPFLASVSIMREIGLLCENMSDLLVFCNRFCGAGANDAWLSFVKSKEFIFLRNVNCGF